MQPAIAIFPRSVYNRYNQDFLGGRPMKSCIVISDSFKGSLSSAEICAIALQTIPAFFPDCHVTAIPVADGGEGTVDCFLAALPGERRTAVVQGPFGESVEAAYALIGEDAVVEMAAAAGLPLAGSRLDPASRLDLRRRPADCRRDRPRCPADSAGARRQRHERRRLWSGRGAGRGILR
jgi:hypothetical protein